MLEGSLMDGSTGLAVVLEMTRAEFPELAQQLPVPAWDRVRKYLMPFGEGIGVMNPRSLKFDFSHAQGTAGILEALLWCDGRSAQSLRPVDRRLGP